MTKILVLLLAALSWSQSSAPGPAGPGRAPNMDLPIDDGRVRLERLALKRGQRAPLDTGSAPLIYLLSDCTVQLERGKQPRLQIAGSAKQALVSDQPVDALIAQTDCELLVIRPRTRLERDEQPR